MKCYGGQIADIRIYNRILTGINNRFFSTRLLYMTWYERLWYWTRETVRILGGQKRW